VLIVARWPRLYCVPVFGTAKAYIEVHEVGSDEIDCSSVQKAVYIRNLSSGLNLKLTGAVLILLIAGPGFSQSAPPWIDASPHHATLVAVEKDLRLEVLDWGGSGKPLVLAARIAKIASLTPIQTNPQFSAQATVHPNVD
jgi:hypothetical protein